MNTAPTLSPAASSWSWAPLLRSMTHRTWLTTGTESAEILGRSDDLTARRDHILDHEQLAASDLGAFGELGGPIRLGRLAHEHRLESCRERERSGKGHTPELEAGKDLGAGGYQRCGVSHHLTEQYGVALEQVLVEVVVGHLSRPENEGPLEPAAIVDKGGKTPSVHCRQSGAAASLAQQPEVRRQALSGRLTATVPRRGHTTAGCS